MPYRLFGGFSYLKRKEIKDIISYFRFIMDETKMVHFKRIIDRPSRGIGDKTIEKVEDIMQEQNIGIYEAIDILFENNPSSKNQSLKDFKEILCDLKNKINTMSLIEFFDELIDKTGFLEMLKQEDDEEINRVENLMEFKSILYSVEETFEGQEISQVEKIQACLDEVLLDQSYADDQSKEGITLSTIHSIKGLEFKAVFVVGLEEGIFPSVREEIDMEEERRVAYVAFTRAKEHLYLSSCARRLIYGRVVRNHKSRFLTEFLISNDLQEIMEKQAEIKKVEGEIKVGSKVNHTFFGYGLVIASDEKFIQILFEKDNTIRKITKDHPTISLINE